MIASKNPSQLLLSAVPAQEVAPGPPRSLGAQPEAVAEIRVPPEAVGMGTAPQYLAAPGWCRSGFQGAHWP